MSDYTVPMRQVGDHAVIGGSVWVLLTSHRDGTDLSVHHSVAGAREALLGYVDTHWEDRPELGTPPIDDSERVVRYFEAVKGDEYYAIERLPLLP